MVFVVVLELFDSGPVQCLIENNMEVAASAHQSIQSGEVEDVRVPHVQEVNKVLGYHVHNFHRESSKGSPAVAHFRHWSVRRISESAGGTG